jgi:Dyp-type peroxidase family
MPAIPLNSEPLLEMEDIQGNILAGFNKDHQAFLFLAINLEGGDAEANQAWAKRWLGQLVPRISTAAEVHQFNQLFRAIRARRNAEPRGLVASWINIAFTKSGIAKLVSPEAAEAFKDNRFVRPMRDDAATLDDPRQPEHPGHATQWRFGGTQTPIDLVIIVASDSAAVLRAEVEKVRASLAREGPTGALREVFLQWGHALPPPLTGHEHFGFKDGVSQPGVRGRVSELTPLTRRTIAPTDPQQQNDSRPEQSRPGQPLIWPGQFVFGYERQNKGNPRQPIPVSAGPVQPVPVWARNGSYLVCRRLTQNVGAFDRFVAAAARQLAEENPALAFLTPERFAALLVGRWPSGAPLSRQPATGRDDAELGKNEFAHNHFRFQQDARPVVLGPEFAGLEGEFAQARADRNGTVCPFSAHIRKVNPRDKTTELGGEADTLTRLVLRRGIPFGDPLPDRQQPENDPLEGDRGLMFLCYQTSIDGQFRVLNAKWANSAANPASGGGHDPIIGQFNNSDGSRGTRTLTLKPPGASAEVKLEVPGEWVTVTGGDYFFAPGIRALEAVFAGSATDLQRLVDELSQVVPTEG